MEQSSILPLGAFPAPGEDQHRGVQAGGIGTSRALGNNNLDEKNFASRRHGCSADGQDSDRRLVIPVVHDPLQQVGMPAGRHSFRKVAQHLLDTTAADVPVDGPAGRLHHVGKVEEYSQPTPVSGPGPPSAAHHVAANVNDPPVAGES
jgi:hypothetical protein